MGWPSSLVQASLCGRGLSACAYTDFIRWLLLTVSCQDRVLLVMEHPEKKACGTTRLDHKCALKETEMSWTIAPHARGMR